MSLLTSKPKYLAVGVKKEPVRYVTLLSGRRIPVDSKRTAAQARCCVAACMGVSPTQVVLMYGARILHGSEPLSVLNRGGYYAREEPEEENGAELSAVIRKRPMAAATVPDGAGYYRNMLLHPQRCMQDATARGAVKVPSGVEPNEWLIAQMCMVYEQIAELPSQLQDKCTTELCPHMSAGENFRFCWRDSHSSKVRDLSAPDYTDQVIFKAHELLFQESFCPSHGQPMPEGFHDNMKSVAKGAFRIYAHIYHHHLKELPMSTLELTSNFAHLYFLAKDFDLLQSMELAPLGGVIHHIEQDPHIM